MAKHDLDFDLDFHQRWVDKLVSDSPSPHKKSKIDENTLLTVWEKSTEHVLRGSKSFAARSLRSRARLSSLQFRAPRSNNENFDISADASHEPTPIIVTSVPAVLGEIANNGQMLHQGPWRHRRSPTPSIRKKKIEDLVKHHGSPRHVRVTAGGRIVPSEQSPLCHPRFGYSAIKTNGGLVKVVPNHNNSKAQWTNATQDGFIAQDVDGRLCQIVNGTIMPLQEQDGMLRLYVSAPNLNMTQRGPSLTGIAIPVEHTKNVHEQTNGQSIRGPPATQQPTVAAQKNALELKYSKLDHELKDLDKTEVLHGRTMGKVAKDALIGKRRELVTSMDRIRKAIKSLNDMPPDVQIPNSPKAMRQQSVLPPQDSLPPFLNRFRHGGIVAAPQQHLALHSFNHPYFGAMMPPQPAGTFGYPPVPSPDANFVASPYAMAQPGFYMQPPPFDGSMAPYPMYPASVPTAAAPAKQQSAEQDTSDRRDSAHGNIPQNDGAVTATDIKVSPRRQSYAVTVKDPETKKVMNIKSMLNPMSPIYKPRSTLRQDIETEKSIDAGSDIPPNAPLVQNASPVAKRSGPQGVDGISPAKKQALMNSSSVSSIRTVDFFPRNTREYSSRKHEYPTPNDDVEDKENAPPEQRDESHSDSPSPVIPTRELHNINWNPNIPDAAFVKFISPRIESYAAPTAPPGTPVNASAGSEQSKHVLHLDKADWHRRGPSPVPELEVEHVPNRQIHNLSPKSKRKSWQFIQENPKDYTSDVLSSSPAKAQDRRDEPYVVSTPDRTPEVPQHSQTWTEGYQAGLHRRPVGSDRMGDFLAGYCVGLMRSEVITTVSTGMQTSDPVKPLSRRPSPAPISQPSPMKLDVPRPPFEMSLKSIDTLKQAVFAPQNENAVLTPAIDGPHVDDAQMYLRGAWQKRHQNAFLPTSSDSSAFPFPQRVVSAADDRVGNDPSTSDGAQDSSTSDHDVEEQPLTASAAPVAKTGKVLPSVPRSRTTGGQLPSERLNSITSIDSTIYRPWPSNRILSLTSTSDWKSQSSVSPAANIAKGFFANTPIGFDGARSVKQNDTELYSRFRENTAELDGIDSSPVSPRPTSPALAPGDTLSPAPKPLRASPAKDERERVLSGKSNFSPSPKKSPGKVEIERVLSGKSEESVASGTSPTKVRFESLAGKVGIKVGEGKKEGEASPPGKKGWRGLWRGTQSGA
ncbi:hypothetical protein B0A48_05004 [Cryoendolithus antarcticus]|uniref:Uncharacterized protein n=1 Tax=Cryoendolithus antarcticus TaxID=1507870 RepID=A0A1V8TEF8_9PEZI|nr:hypothetical protein B0A48_05004 [Cryoendolithus antarcticus]